MMTSPHNNMASWPAHNHINHTPLNVATITIVTTVIEPFHYGGSHYNQGQPQQLHEPMQDSANHRIFI